MKTAIAYSIAGIDVPYYIKAGWVDGGYKRYGIDKTVLNTVVDRTTRLFRSNGDVIEVKILEIDDKTYNITYQEPSGCVGICYWYRFYRRQYRPVK